MPLGFRNFPRPVVRLAVAAATTLITASSLAGAATSSTRVIQIQTGELREVSGCAASRRDTNRVWMHNDSGDGARIGWLNLVSRARGFVEVRGAQAVDWEDMAPAPGGRLIIGDIGDNNRSRANVVLYEIPDTDAAAVDATAQTLTYADGAHDAEALVVDPASGAAYVITKESSGRAGVYRADGASLVRVAELRITGELGFYPNRITAADALPDCSGIVVRTYLRGYILRKSKDAPFASAFSATPRVLALPSMIQPEALCVTPDGQSVVTTTESFGSPTIPVAVVKLPN
jgi:hypothetical protein